MSADPATASDLITLAFNLIADHISNRFKEEGSGTL